MQTVQQQKNYRVFVTLRRLMRRNATPNIKKIMFRIHPADLAQVFSYFTVDDRIVLLGYIPSVETRAAVIIEMSRELSGETITQLGAKEAADIVCELSPDDQADLLGQIDEEMAHEILQAMPRKDSDDVQELMRYDAQSAGGIMNPDVLSVHMDCAVSEAVDKVRQSTDVDMVFYIYVVDDHDTLVGVLSLRHLVISSPQTSIKEIMNPNVVSVHTEEDQEDVARHVTRYDFLAIPVVDDTNRLVGVVSVDDVIDVISEEATEDFLKLAGASDESLESRSPVRHVLSRAPWLFAALVGGVGGAIIIRNFEQTLSRYLMLAAFIPVIIGMAGNVGTQSLAIVIRGLATRQIRIRQAAKTIGNELLVGAILGVLYGTVLALVGFWQFQSSPSVALQLALAVGAATLAAMILAALVASSVPLACAKLNIDPAIATGPFVTTTIDILGVLIYFSVVNMFVATT